MLKFWLKLLVLFLIVFLLYIFWMFLPQKKLISTIRPFEYFYTIPKIIHRTHKSLVVPEYMHYYCDQKWIMYNPNFSMFWYDQKDMDQFMEKMPQRIFKAYKKLIPGAYKADLWRACILYEYGGIYIDSYTEPYCSIARMLSGIDLKKYRFISVKDKFGIHNGVIMCTKNHPILKKYIKKMVENIEQNYYGENDLEITGPGCLAKVVEEILGKKVKIGENPHEKYPIFLFELESSLAQYVKKNKEKIMRKKYSVLHLFYQKILSYNSSYYSLWKNRKVFKESF